MKKKQQNKLLTPIQLSKLLCQDKSLSKLRLAMTNMDGLFRSYLSFNQDSWLWSKRVKQILVMAGTSKKPKTEKHVEVEYLINGVVRMRYNINMESKTPHHAYIVQYLSLQTMDYLHETFNGQRTSYFELRNLFKKDIVMTAVSKL